MFHDSFNNVMITMSYEVKSDIEFIDNQLKSGAKLLSNLKVFPLVTFKFERHPDFFFLFSTQI